MKYKKITLGISICSFLFISACKKADEPKAQIKANHAEASAPNSVVQPSSEKELMLQAIEKNKKELQADHCAIDELDDDAKKIVVGDLNQDGQNDFIYDYAVVDNCGSQTTSHVLGIFLKSGSKYVLDSVYQAGLNELNHLKLHDINEKGQLNVDLDESKTKMVYQNKDLVEVEDPNKKVLIPLGQEMSANESPFATVLDRMTYVADNVECGGFFSDEQAEKSTTIDHYSLRVSGDQVAVLGVYGLTKQDQVKVFGKVVTSDTTLAQIKPWFKSGFETNESKDKSHEIGSASEGAASLKYDLMYSVRDKNSENVVLFYFFKGKLVGIQYFIPC